MIWATMDYSEISAQVVVDSIVFHAYLNFYLFMVFYR